MTLRDLGDWDPPEEDTMPELRNTKDALEVSAHAGSISPHNSFSWMARCVRDRLAADGLVSGCAECRHTIQLIEAILDRLALIEGTSGAQWDDFLPLVGSPLPPALGYHTSDALSSDGWANPDPLPTEIP